MKIKRVLLLIGAFVLFGMSAGLMAKTINGSKEIKQAKADTADVTISTDAEFASFISAVNGGTRYDNQVVQLTNDVSYEITAQPTAADPWSIFAGEFDGLNHTITVSINTTATYVGLFRNIGNAEFKNAVFKNANINCSITQSATSGSVVIAPVAVYNNGLIQNVHTTVNFNISGASYFAGVVAKNQSAGIIENCSADGSIKGKQKVAGITAENEGQIINCVNNCAIESVSSSYAGGITAINGVNSTFVKAKIVNCINNANVTATSTDLGGIAAFMYSNSEISYCSNYGNITSTNTGTGCGYGGIVGRINGADSNTGHSTKIEYCYNAGNVSSVRNCGGLIGLVNSGVKPAIEITGNLTAGDINGTTENAGTLIGWVNSNTITVTDSWAVGAKLGVTALGIGAGSAAGATYSKADGVSDDFRAIIKAIREYNCVAISGFGTLYGGLDDGEKALLNTINYYDELNTYAMKTYGQAAEYIIDDQAHGARISLLDLNNNYWAIIVVISVMVLSTAAMVFVIRRKKHVASK